MMYIGGRYIPKNGGIWNKNLPYEALVYVSYNNKMYISNIPVPTNVEITNTKYWSVLTDLSNITGKISNIEDNIEIINSEIEGIDSKLTNITTKINFSTIFSPSEPIWSTSNHTVSSFSGEVITFICNMQLYNNSPELLAFYGVSTINARFLNITNLSPGALTLATRRLRMPSPLNNFLLRIESGSLTPINASEWVGNNDVLGVVNLKILTIEVI